MIFSYFILLRFDSLISIPIIKLLLLMVISEILLVYLVHSKGSQYDGVTTAVHGVASCTLAGGCVHCRGNHIFFMVRPPSDSTHHQTVLRDHVLLGRTLNMTPWCILLSLAVPIVLLICHCWYLCWVIVVRIISLVWWVTLSHSECSVQSVPSPSLSVITTALVKLSPLILLLLQLILLSLIHTCSIVAVWCTCCSPTSHSSFTSCLCQSVDTLFVYHHPLH